MAKLLALFFILVIGLGAALLFYSYVPGETVPLISIDIEPPLPNRTYTPSVQFYPDMRFPSSDITYHIESACTDNKRADVEEAFTILEDETPLSFSEISNEPQISILCSQLPPEPTKRRHFVAGEGGPTEILNTSQYAIILAGEISLYRAETCETPHIALHEILHVLGFDHNDNPRSILYPTLDCSQILDSYLVKEIERLYEDPATPDLRIADVEGNKSGRYLSFTIEVTNEGLVDAKDVSLRVFADEEVIQDFELDDIPVGAKKILTVTNLNVGRRASRIVFEVDSLDTIDELEEGNNKKELLIGTD